MKRKRIRMLTMVLIAAFSITLVWPLAGSAAPMVDLERECSLTVYAVNESSDYAEDLETVDLVYDLYKIANLEENEGYDGYFYRMNGIYENISPLYTEKLMLQSENSDIKAEDWEELAEEAMSFALFGMGREDRNQPDSQPIEGDRAQVQPEAGGFQVGTRLGGLEAGLYLLVARDASLKNVESYTDIVTDQEGRDHLVTVAYSEAMGYTFAPSLISVPTKEEFEGVLSTGNPGEWIYDASVYLKPEEIPYGALRIIKNLPIYEDSDEAIFVFDVEAVLNGRNVYSDVVSINFTEPGSQSVVIEKLPVGAQVTVTEIYSGAGYVSDPENPPVWTVPGPGEVPGIITPSDIVTIEFTNRYDENRRGGHGITNQFYYDFDGPGGWEVKQVMTQDDREHAGISGASDMTENRQPENGKPADDPSAE